MEFVLRFFNVIDFLPQPKPVKQPKKRKPFSPKRRKKPVSDAESWYMGQVKQLPCVITGEYGVIAHHVCHDRRGRGKWNGFSCIPLVARLHDRMTDEGIHEHKETWRENHGPDWSYIPDVLEAVYGDEWNVDH